MGLEILIAIPLILYPLLYFGQERLLFHPQPLDPVKREQVLRNHPDSEVTITAEDGTTLHGWLHRPPGAPPEEGRGAPLIIAFWGNAEEASSVHYDLHHFRGWAVLSVNYRGYGLSEGEPTEAALFADATTLYDWARRQEGIDPERIVLLGRSIGSGVAVHLAAERSVAAVILVTPYDSMVAVAGYHYPYVPVKVMLRHRFDSLARAPKIREPMLALVAERDQTIPPKHAHRLIEAWGGTTRTITIPNADHNSLVGEPLYWQEIRRFLEEIARGDAPSGDPDP
ncbi:MAG: alpha/beta hydrolase [Magnetococcales bacterium]|nr:alpha/beta hydrolase [Magnetococcales bacterium]